MRLYLHLFLIILSIAIGVVFNGNELMEIICVGNFFVQVWLAHDYVVKDEEYRKNKTPERKSIL